MKSRFGLIILWGGSLFCGGHEPPLAGNWQFAVQSLEYRGDGEARVPLAIESETEALQFFSDGTFSASSGGGSWLFSDDLLLVVQPGNVEVLATTETGDTFMFAGDEFDDLGGGVFEKKVRFQAAVKSPVTPFSQAQVAGEWVILQQELEYRDSPSGGSPVRTLREISQSRTDVTLNVGGSFQAEIISDTNDPGDVGNLINGTWLMNSGVLEATVGLEVTVRTHFSSGGDLLVHTEEASAPDGSDTLFSSRLDFWVKKASALVVGDIVGCWAIAGMTIDLEVDAGGGGQYLEEVGFEESLLDFRGDGTGTRQITDNGEVTAIGRTEEFTWVLDDAELLVTTDAGTFRFVVTAEKDFAVMQNFEANLAEETETFDFFGLAKLPDAPGFGGRPICINLLDVGGDTKAVLTTPTMVGLRYQVEVSEDLVGWQALGPIMAGTGGTISSNLPALASEGSYFRWRIVPPSS